MRFFPIFAISFLLATAAEAHTGLGTASGGGVYGFLPPFSGLDHLLAMAGVGLLGFFLGGRAIWLVPAAFLVMMLAGAGLAVAGFGLPFVETGIALSVVVIGGALAFGRSLPLALAVPLAGGFAVFHGFAHGAEMPATATGFSYGLGFLAATALLHAAGLALGFGLDRAVTANSKRLARIGGALLSLSGLAILGGAF